MGAGGFEPLTSSVSGRIRPAPSLLVSAVSADQAQLLRSGILRRTEPFLGMFVAHEWHVDLPRPSVSVPSGRRTTRGRGRRGTDQHPSRRTSMSRWRRSPDRQVTTSAGSWARHGRPSAQKHWSPSHERCCRRWKPPAARRRTWRGSHRGAEDRRDDPRSEGTDLRGVVVDSGAKKSYPAQARSPAGVPRGQKGARCCSSRRATSERVRASE